MSLIDSQRPYATLLVSLYLNKRAAQKEWGRGTNSCPGILWGPSSIERKDPNGFPPCFNNLKSRHLIHRFRTKLTPFKSPCRKYYTNNVCPPVALERFILVLVVKDCTTGFTRNVVVLSGCIGPIPLLSPPSVPLLPKVSERRAGTGRRGSNVARFRNFVNFNRV